MTAAARSQIAALRAWRRTRARAVGTSAAAPALPRPGALVAAVGCTSHPCSRAPRAGPLTRPPRAA
eukprot:8444195-Alexandrium_andersonii.AAC.1